MQNRIRSAVTTDESREEATIRAVLSEERGDVKEFCAELGQGEQVVLSYHDQAGEQVYIGLVEVNNGGRGGIKEGPDNKEVRGGEPERVEVIGDNQGGGVTGVSPGVKR